MEPVRQSVDPACPQAGGIIMVRLRRYNVENLAYFVTTSSYQNRINLLTRDRAETLINFIYAAKEKLVEHLLAFAIMPNHLHILFVPKPGVTISQVLHYIKKGSSRVVSGEEEGKQTLWTRRFHDKGIRTEEQLRKTIEYIHNNPVKAGLVERAEEYLYSSANPKWRTDRENYLIPR
jgi:REP element-mobilizing transposase RayT